VEVIAAAAVITATCAAIGVVAIRAADAGTQVLTVMFRSPAELGWPHGVQEDDDLHWSWSSPPAGVAIEPSKGVAADASGDPVSRPEIVDLPAGAGPPTGRVRAA
jgi:hypothetical protein